GRRHPHRLPRPRADGRADGGAAVRPGRGTPCLRPAAGGGGAVRGARRGGLRLAQGGGRRRQHRAGVPAQRRGQRGRGTGAGGRGPWARHPRLRGDVHHRPPRRGAHRGGAGGARHRRRGHAHHRRPARGARGHASSDGRRRGRRCRDAAALFGAHRQEVVRARGEAGPGPGDEAGQQPADRGQHGVGFRGAGHGRQGGARPRCHGGRGERRHRPQLRHQRHDAGRAEPPLRFRRCDRGGGQGRASGARRGAGAGRADVGRRAGGAGVAVCRDAGHGQGRHLGTGALDGALGRRGNPRPGGWL
ncbi:MAG: hypothetical protein AVDCRST_MAG04-3688, partial [uncultured Acetobacteraceae bacterium]